ncbi:MAG: hypothetical protein NC122_08285 [Faecalibacterium sp.]|nr:hypothetical protein [Ruminococcus sp.]MCM1392435.1 hypothetical protein [Ruminococcus sp.]MCM1486192.1 hypothetical protein [Faecalibacterium sp.]
MKANRLLHEIGQVDSKFIVEAAPKSYKSQKGRFKKILAVAACFVIFFSVGLGLWRGNVFNKTEVISLEGGNELYFYKSSSSQNSLNIDLDVTPRQLTKTELSKVFGNLSIEEANGLFEKDKLIGVEGTISGMKFIISYSDVNLKDTIVEGKEKKSTVNNVSVNGGYFITKANSKGEKNAIYYAEFEIGDKKIYIENAGNESEKDKVKNELVYAILQLTEFADFDFTLVS